MTRSRSKSREEKKKRKNSKRKEKEEEKEESSSGSSSVKEEKKVAVTMTEKKKSKKGGSDKKKKETKGKKEEKPAKKKCRVVIDENFNEAFSVVTSTAPAALDEHEENDKIRARKLKREKPTISEKRDNMPKGAHIKKLWDLIIDSCMDPDRMDKLINERYGTKKDKKTMTETAEKIAAHMYSVLQEHIDWHFTGMVNPENIYIAMFHIMKFGPDIVARILERPTDCIRYMPVGVILNENGDLILGTAYITLLCDTDLD